MTSIPALVLCYDRDIELALMMIESYRRLAPHLPLQFLVPCNSDATARLVEARFASPDVRVVRSPRNLLPCLHALLASSQPSPWIYWCASDRYPISIADQDALAELFDAATNGAFDDYDSIRLMRWRELENRAAGDRVQHTHFDFVEIPSSLPTGFWHHQLMKRVLLARLIENVSIDISLRDFHDEILKRLGGISGRTLLPSRSMVKLDESTFGGHVTLNAYVLLSKRRRLEPNDRPVTLRTVGFHSPRIRKTNRFWRQKQPDGPVSPEKLIERRPPESPRILVYTYGGTGSKMFARWIYAEDHVTDLRTAHSHWRIPPLSIAPHQQVMYVFGDPRNTVMSFFQRRESRHAGHGFPGKRLKQGPVPDFCKRALRYLEAAKGKLDESWNLEQYLSQDLDLFRLEEHFDYWMYAERDYPIHFVRYEKAWQNVALLADLFGADASTFPAPVERRARLQDQTPWVIERLDFLYGSFVERLSSLPDVFRMENGRLIEMTPSDGTYRYSV